MTPGWVKIVVDIGARALPTTIDAGMFVCFMIYSKIRTGHAAAFGNDVLPRDVISRFDVSKRIKQTISRRTSPSQASLQKIFL